MKRTVVLAMGCLILVVLQTNAALVDLRVSLEFVSAPSQYPPNELSRGGGFQVTFFSELLTDSNPSSQIGYFEGQYPTFQRMVYTFSGGHIDWTHGTALPAKSISVQNGSADDLVITTVPFNSFGVEGWVGQLLLHDSSGTVLDSDALPTTPFSLSNFDSFQSSYFQFININGGYDPYIYRLTDLAVSFSNGVPPDPPNGDPTVVPEPPTCLAGVLLVIPLGMQFMRVLRKQIKPQQ